jgi:replication initiation protein RepC
MQHISSLIVSEFPSRGGGRLASPGYRLSLAQSEEFAGLEEGIDRYDLLLLVKRVGKGAGFTPRMIHLLDYYLAFTRDCDWEQGSRPIVYQSLSRTALDLGISERQVQKLEQALFHAGALTWCDSGNHKRYGQRHPQTGRILFAYGVDLTPLAYLREQLTQLLQEKRLYDEAWLDTKRAISWQRRQIRSLLLEMQEEGADASALARYEERYQEIACQIRTQIDLSELRLLLTRHQSLHSDLLTVVAPKSGQHAEAHERANLPQETPKGSCTSERKFAHYKYTNPVNKFCSPQDTGFQESVADLSEPEDQPLASGMQHISLKQVLLAASDRFRAGLPLEPRPMNWNDVVEAAYRLRPELGISQQSWGEACQILGKVGAALCLLITDSGLDRDKNSVKQPAAYFRGLVNRARGGELHLHNSVYGLIEREILKGSASSQAQS